MPPTASSQAQRRWCRFAITLDCLRPAGRMTLFSSTYVANTAYKRSPAFSPIGEMHWLLRRMVTGRNKKHRGDPSSIAQLQSIVSDRERVFSWAHSPLVQVGALNRRPSQVKESPVLGRLECNDNLKPAVAYPNKCHENKRRMGKGCKAITSSIYPTMSSIDL